MKSSIFFPTLCLALLLTVPATAERFSGNIIDAGGAVPRRSSTYFRLEIEQYTSEEEAVELIEVLAKEGPDGLRKALEKLDRGWISIGPRTGYPIAFARSFDTPEGRIVRIATDRPVSFIEARSMLRTMGYPFGIIELQLDQDGKGEGRLIAAAEIKFNKEGRLEIESFGLEPFRILRARVEPEKKKKKKKGKK